MPERTRTWAIITMIVATLFNSGAQLLYKHAVDASGLSIANLLAHGTIILGLIAYGVSGILLILALRGGQASVLYPIYTLSFVWIALGSRIIFGIDIPTQAIIGMIAVIAGIIIINQGRQVPQQKKSTRGTA